MGSYLLGEELLGWRTGHGWAEKTDRSWATSSASHWGHCWDRPRVQSWPTLWVAARRGILDHRGEPPGMEDGTWLGREDGSLLVDELAVGLGTLL